MDITVAIDCMGGDHGPHVTVPAALTFLRAQPQVNIVLVGLEDAIRIELKAHKAEIGPRLRIRHASEVVTMDESFLLRSASAGGSSIVTTSLA